MKQWTFFFLLLPSIAWGEIALSVGPQSYHLKRYRDGGTQQTGRLDGVAISLERVRGNGWYLGGDYLYARGELKGRTRSQRRLYSEASDEIIEGRLGYTLQQRQGGCPFITPFGGYGYFREKNTFRSPSPLLLTFTDSFGYIVTGFLSGVNITPLLSMGLNFKVRFMQGGESRVSDDPFMDDVTLKMKDAMQMRVDVPIQFSPCQTLASLSFSLTPFYEHRHFGGKIGYPFDFIDTKFDLLGATASVVYHY